MTPTQPADDNSPSLPVPTSSPEEQAQIDAWLDEGGSLRDGD